MLKGEVRDQEVSPTQEMMSHITLFSFRVEN